MMAGLKARMAALAEQRMATLRARLAEAANAAGVEARITDDGVAVRGRWLRARWIGDPRLRWIGRWQ
jgi:hypothetical protein